MDFTTAIKTVYFEKYRDFYGRASRSEYWWSLLFGFIVNVAIHFVFGDEGSLALFGTLISAVMLLPTIAVAIRRLHDIDKSGLWILISLIPLIGVIWYLVLMARPGESTANRYGLVPTA